MNHFNLEYMCHCNNCYQELFANADIIIQQKKINLRIGNFITIFFFQFAYNSAPLMS